MGSPQKGSSLQSTDGVVLRGAFLFFFLGDAGVVALVGVTNQSCFLTLGDAGPEGVVVVGVRCFVLLTDQLCQHGL